MVWETFMVDISHPVQHFPTEIGYDKSLVVGYKIHSTMELSQQKENFVDINNFKRKLEIQ